jgi:hypothetical protein
LKLFSSWFILSFWKYFFPWFIQLFWNYLDSDSYNTIEITIILIHTIILKLPNYRFILPFRNYPDNDSYWDFEIISFIIHTRILKEWTSWFIFFM